MNNAAHMKETIDSNHEQLTEAINHLYNLFNVNFFEDENQDGENDNPDNPDSLVTIDNDGGITIVE